MGSTSTLKAVTLSSTYHTLGLTESDLALQRSPFG